MNSLPKISNNNLARADNILILPNDILSLICMQLTIEDIENLCKACDYSILSHKQFWVDYYKLHIGRPITNEHNNSFDWIVEFNILHIIEIFYYIERNPCCNVIKTYPQIITCGKKSVVGSDYCRFHNRNKELTIIFECENNIYDLINDFEFIHHSSSFLNDDETKIIINENYIEILFNTEVYCLIINEITMGNFLFKLYYKKVIKNTKYTEYKK